MLSFLRESLVAVDNQEWVDQVGELAAAAAPASPLGGGGGRRRWRAV